MCKDMHTLIYIQIFCYLFFKYFITLVPWYVLSANIGWVKRKRVKLWMPV